MLQQKQVRHGLLLVALQVGGVLQRLPPPVLATLFEHAQMLAAAAGVLEYQRACEQAAAGNDAAQQGGFEGEGGRVLSVGLPQSRQWGKLEDVGALCGLKHTCNAVPLTPNILSVPCCVLRPTSCHCS